MMPDLLIIMNLYQVSSIAFNALLCFFVFHLCTNGICSLNKKNDLTCLFFFISIENEEYRSKANNLNKELDGRLKGVFVTSTGVVSRIAIDFSLTQFPK